MRYIYLLLLLALLSCNEQKNNSETTENSENTQSTIINDTIQQRKKEIAYIKRRNANIPYFENKEVDNDSYDEVYDQMDDSIAALETLFKHILIDTKIKNIDPTAQINLQTFIPEIGFEMLDALGTYNEGVHTLYTTPFIYSDYFKKQEYTVNNLSESQLEDIFSSAFASDYAITGIHTFKINNKQNIQAYGMISIDGQDIGPFIPNNLYVIAVIDDIIYLIDKSIETELKPLEKCKNMWGNISDISEEDLVWESYCECYEKEYENNEQATLLKKEIEQMLMMIAE